MNQFRNALADTEPQRAGQRGTEDIVKDQTVG